jgi:hypothetical protein
VNKSNLGDTEILNNTVRAQDERGNAQLRYTLPSGRTVTSEWIDPNQLKGKVFIQWCAVVRDQDQVDIQEREAKEEQAIAAKRQRALTSPAPSTEHVPVRSANSNRSDDGLETQSVETSPALSTPSSPRSVQLPDDPQDMVSAKLNALRIQLAQVQDQLSELCAQEIALKQAIERWATVAASLQGPSGAPPPGLKLKLSDELPRPGQIILMEKA